MLKALIAVIRAGKYGVDIVQIIEGLKTLQSDIVDLDKKQLVSQQVGTAQVAGRNIKYGVWAQEV